VKAGGLTKNKKINDQLNSENITGPKSGRMAKKSEKETEEREEFKGDTAICGTLCICQVICKKCLKIKIVAHFNQLKL
jgi:hypothetical protein